MQFAAIRIAMVSMLFNPLTGARTWFMIGHAFAESIRFQVGNITKWEACFKRKPRGHFAAWV